uniref:Uncharacterized protein n=1 Tax=Arundo donax TaxID=35708 RepID=A0A0A9DXH7_ARUDO
MSIASLVLFSSQRVLSRCVKMMASTLHPVLITRPNAATPRSNRPAWQQQLMRMLYVCRVRGTFLVPALAMRLKRETASAGPSCKEDDAGALATTVRSWVKA